MIIAILQNTQRIYPNKIFENDIYSLQNLKLKHFRASRKDSIYRE